MNHPHRDPLDPRDPVDPFVDYLHAAIAGLHCSLKAASIDLGLGDQPAYLSKVMAGEKPFPYRRLTSAALPLQRAICTAWAVDLGLAVGERAALYKMAETVLQLATIEQRQGSQALRRMRTILEDLPRPRPARVAEP